MTPVMTASARNELAPNGRLRVGLNYANFLLVSTRAPNPTGVAPDLGRELSQRLAHLREVGDPVDVGDLAREGVLLDRHAGERRCKHQAEGEDADAALAALQKLIADRFDEGE